MQHPTDNIPVETHPWEPWTPQGARLLMLGTFPPGPQRRSIDFYYPNRTNDFWYMIGLILRSDRTALLDADGHFNLHAIKDILTQHHIALGDTARRVRRLRGNASDKYLDIIEPIDLRAVLSEIPQCHTIATTGEKAARVIADITGTAVPPIGQPLTTPDGLTIWRMPSTSRAYPMPLDTKAEPYRRLFQSVGIISPTKY